MDQRISPRGVEQQDIPKRMIVMSVILHHRYHSCRLLIVGLLQNLKKSTRHFYKSTYDSQTWMLVVQNGMFALVLRFVVL